MSTYIYPYAYIKHAWNISIPSFTYSFNSCGEIFTVPRARNIEMFCPEGEEEMGTSNTPMDHRINAKILTQLSTTPPDRPSSDSWSPTSPALALTKCES